MSYVTRNTKAVHKDGSVLVGTIFADQGDFDTISNWDEWEICVGDRDYMYLTRDSGWTLTVEPDPLPSEDGWYESERYPLWDGNYYPYVRKGGVWYEAVENGWSEVFNIQNAMPLRRLGTKP